MILPRRIQGDRCVEAGSFGIAYRVERESVVVVSTDSKVTGHPQIDRVVYTENRSGHV